MLSSKFGIEIEFTGITRQQAAEVISKYFDCGYYRTHDYYDSYIIKSSDTRDWKLMYDSSIQCRRRDGRRLVSAGNEYACELVSPILTYREANSSTSSPAEMICSIKHFRSSLSGCGIA